MKRILFVTVLALMLLAGCGGGGGGDFRGLIQGTWKNKEGQPALDCQAHPGKLHKWEIEVKFNKLNELVWARVRHVDGNEVSEACLTGTFKDRRWENKGLQLTLRLEPVPGTNLHHMTKLQINTDEDEEGLVLTAGSTGSGLGDTMTAQMIGIEYGEGPDYQPFGSNVTWLNLELERVAL